MTATRIPLNTFAIGFGLAGLAEAWTTAGEFLSLPDLVGQLFWVVAAGAWLWLIVAHTVRGARSSETLVGQLRHPAQGPIAALIPIAGMLIAGELMSIVYWLGLALYLVSLVATFLFAAWLVSLWLRGGLALESIHGGYLLPTVAAGFIGATCAARAGIELLGWALFGIGLFFWAVMTVLLIIRLAFRPALPDPLVPTMAILVAPPAVAGIAWFQLTTLTPSVVAAMLAGMGLLLLLVQLLLVPMYSKLTFSLGFWSFTFPAAAVVTDALLWVHVRTFPGWQAVSIVLLAVITVLVAAIAVRSLVEVFGRRRDVAEATLTRANDTDGARAR